MARHGRWNVSMDVAKALIEEAKNCGQSVEQVASTILLYWYEDVFLPTKRAKEKSNDERNGSRSDARGAQS